MDNLTLKLYLNDADAVQRYSYTYQCQMADFTPVVYEEIGLLLPDIVQGETDKIENGETMFFVWAEPEKWGFSVIPICRIDDELHLGYDRFFPFENENWVLNLFDGTH